MLILYYQEAYILSLLWYDIRDILKAYTVLSGGLYSLVSVVRSL